MLYIGQDIILPLIFALILAILLNPFVNYLQRKKLNRILAILVAVFLIFIFSLGIAYFISSQLSMFAHSLPQLKSKFNSLITEMVRWVSLTFNVSITNINEWLATQKSESINNSTAVIGQTLTTISGVLIIVFLLPVYVFMFLFYKPLLLNFIAQLFPDGKHKTVEDVLNQTKSLIQSYLIGLLIEAAIVATLNSTALLILGIDYAILIGIIGALLNIIPYIGGVIAISIPMILALVTKDPIYALWVILS